MGVEIILLNHLAENFKYFHLSEFNLIFKEK